MISVILAIGSVFVQPESTFAQTTSSTANVAKYSTTKGVRTKTAYPKRRTGATATKTKRAYAAPRYRTVSLPPEVPEDGSSSDIINRAMSMVGSRYQWGGTSPTTGFDCSGLIRYSLGAEAHQLPRSSYALYQSTKRVNELRPGDIVFFGRRRVSHAGVYIGNGKIVHASTSRRGVRVDNLRTLAYALGFMGVGRV